MLLVLASEHSTEVIGSALTKKKSGKVGGMVGGIHFLKVSLVGEEKIDVFFLRELMLVFFSFHPNGSSFPITNV